MTVCFRTPRSRFRRPPSRGLGGLWVKATGEEAAGRATQDGVLCVRRLPVAGTRLCGVRVGWTTQYDLNTGHRSRADTAGDRAMQETIDVLRKGERALSFFPLRGQTVSGRVPAKWAW
jgi:hypothetical protein